MREQEKMAELQNRYNELESARSKAVADLWRLRQKIWLTWGGQLRTKDADIQSRNTRIQELQAQIDDLRKNNNNLLDRMADLSIVSKQGAESIKKSLETLNEQTKYVNNLNQSIQRKDSVNLGFGDEPETVTRRHQRSGCTGWSEERRCLCIDLRQTSFPFRQVGS